jgi:DNA-binding response OmpR family regulator
VIRRDWTAICEPVGDTAYSMPALILLVELDHRLLQRTEALLSNAGHLVACASSFHDAKRLLESVSPDLLIAAVKLDAFNGIHLAVPPRRGHPRAPVMITNPYPDPVLEAEAARVGASFIADPVNNPDFLPRVADTLERSRRSQPLIRRWPRKQVTGTLQAEIEAVAARVFDVSYGGLRLAFNRRRSLPDHFDLQLRDQGITVKARAVWTYASPYSDEFWCGAEVLEQTEPATAGWRALVDAS